MIIPFYFYLLLRIIEDSSSIFHSFDLIYSLSCFPTKLSNINILNYIISVLLQLGFIRFNKNFYNTIQIKYFFYYLIFFLALLIVYTNNIYYSYTLLFFFINLYIFVYISYINENFHKEYPILYKILAILSLICIGLSALILLHGLCVYINILTSNTLNTLKDYILKASGNPSNSGGPYGPSGSTGPSNPGSSRGPKGPGNIDIFNPKSPSPEPKATSSRPEIPYSSLTCQEKGKRL